MSDSDFNTYVKDSIDSIRSQKGDVILFYVIATTIVSYTLYGLVLSYFKAEGPIDEKDSKRKTIATFAYLMIALEFVEATSMHLNSRDDNTSSLEKVGLSILLMSPKLIYAIWVLVMLSYDEKVNEYPKTIKWLRGTTYVGIVGSLIYAQYGFLSILYFLLRIAY